MRTYRIFIVWGALLLSLLLMIGAFSAAAVYHRVVHPPRIAFTIGRTVFAAPCPPHIHCDAGTPFYAIYRGDPQPDGSMTYKQLWFIYLRKRV